MLAIFSDDHRAISTRIIPSHARVFLALLVFATSAGFAQPLPPPPPPAPPFAYGFASAPRPGGPYLGVGLLEINGDRAAELGMPRPYGVEISSVQEDSPADRAGLEKTDVVLRFDGQRVRGVEHFIRLVRETPVGRTVDLTLWRNRSERTVTVTIGERPARDRSSFFICKDDGEDCEVRIPGFQWKFPRIEIDIPRPRITMQSRYLGAELESVEGQLAQYFGVEEGILVRSVEANTPGDRAGLQAGDVIVSVNGKSVDSPGDVREEIQSAEPQQEVNLEVMRRGSKQLLTLEPREPRDEPQPGRRIRSKSKRL